MPLFPLHSPLQRLGAPWAAQLCDEEVLTLTIWRRATGMRGRYSDVAGRRAFRRNWALHGVWPRSCTPSAEEGDDWGPMVRYEGYWTKKPQPLLHEWAMGGTHRRPVILGSFDLLVHMALSFCDCASSTSLRCWIPKMEAVIRLHCGVWRS